MIVNNENRMQILRTLKRNEASVDELVEVLDISATAVRQHLSILEKNDLVKRTSLKGQKGRPRIIYSITELAEQKVFPKRYSQLIDLLLDELSKHYNKTELNKLLQSIGVTLATKNVLKDDDFKNHLNNVIEAFNELGGDAEVHNSTEKGTYTIYNYNCVFSRLIEKYPSICKIHNAFFEAALGEWADIDHQNNILDNSKNCIYKITLSKK
jgi:predicted ArsR family transcriptional regulator